MSRSTAVDERTGIVKLEDGEGVALKMQVAMDDHLGKGDNFPPLDGQGRLVLVESFRSQMGMAFFGAFSAIITITSALYCFRSIHGSLGLWPPAVLVLCFGPLTVLFGCGFVYPRQVIVDGDGIKFRKLGISSEIRWDDVTSVSAKKIASWVGQAGAQIRYQTWIFVAGRGKKIAWPPVFTMGPDELLGYLNDAWKRYAGR